MVAKILDGNKPKKSPKSLFTLFQISPILFSSIKYGKSRQNFLWDSIYRYLRKRKRQFLFCVHVLVVQRRQRNVKIAWCTSKVIGCLPFTWANRSVYGLGKWYAKFRTGKFSSGIAFTICTDQFHLTENGREGLKLVSKMALRKWNTNFRYAYFIRKNRTTFSDVPLLPEIFRWEDPKSRVPFTFEPDFPENSCKW